jgi:hypothetical protein
MCGEPVMRVRLRGRRTDRFLSFAVAAALGCVASFALSPACADDDVLQRAVNYVFTGEVAPKSPPTIVDRDSCVVVMHDPKYDRFIRYHLRGFEMNTALYDKRYSGPQPTYVLDVKGESIILEYLTPDQKTVQQSYRSAQIPLLGDIDQTRKALDIIFGKFCKPQKTQSPF